MPDVFSLDSCLISDFAHGARFAPYRQKHMAELTSKDRLQPALLMRLTDDAPAIVRESRERRVVSMRQLRENVLRDLADLLNSSRLSNQERLREFPYASRSVLNYGLPDLTGKSQSGLDEQDIANAIASAIRNFEPRILPGSLRVRPWRHSAPDRGNTMVFLVEGDLWAQPYPERLYVRTELDLEDGQMRINAQDKAE
jgi:type VI secretion system protein ImpF